VFGYDLGDSIVIQVEKVSKLHQSSS